MPTRSKHLATSPRSTGISIRFLHLHTLGAGVYTVKRRALSTELLIDCEEDRVLRAVLVGMLREIDR